MSHDPDEGLRVRVSDVACDDCSAVVDGFTTFTCSADRLQGVAARTSWYRWEQSAAPIPSVSARCVRTPAPHARYAATAPHPPNPFTDGRVGVKVAYWRGDAERSLTKCKGLGSLSRIIGRAAGSVYY